VDDKNILASIHCPGDLRALPPAQLPGLAAEIRQVLVETVSHNGGHLASNLGVVELTLALHLCFHSPQDALIWDVSHQSYTHKLLTGRYERFGTLRQSGGLSGFTDPAESEHDFFRSGHASTSVSAALGIAEGKRIRGEDGFAVAVLGDGASTGGLVYEAMNNAGRSGARMIVVLNDNEMSISRNVGGFSRYLSMVRRQPLYRITKRRVEGALRHIPGVGDALARGVSRCKGFIKRLLTNTTLFEDLGFAYIGPVDGHDLGQLCAALTSAKLVPRPALVHVCTTKGKGYTPAEQAPESFHGVLQFDCDTGEALPCGQSFSAVFGEELCALAAQNPDICAVTAAMSMGTGLGAFEHAYPERFFDVGIAEGHAVTFSAGLARQGLRPLFAVYSTFLQRSYDQLLHDVALQGLPLVIVVDRAGFVGEDGATHHGLYDVAFCGSIPGAVVFAPATEAELRLRLRQAMQNPATGAPVFLRLPRGCPCALPPAFPLTDAPFDAFGDEDAPLAIVTYGRLFQYACEAAQRLQARGKQVRLVKLNRVLPIEKSAAQSVFKNQKVCFFEEGTRSGGAGERFGLLLLELGFRGEYDLHAVEGFPRHAPVKELLQEYGLNTEAMEGCVQI
jgi:1-deoxy-D-xylulose-5-phosphate synthase